MSGSEMLLGIVKDIILPVDVNTRYDVYFTDRRVSIVCLGRATRFESEKSLQVSSIPSAFGVPPVTSSYIEKSENLGSIDEEIKGLCFDELLKLSKKSCYYTHEEIEEIKLLLGHKPKFAVLSKDCESKFSPSEEQVFQLIEILPKIGTLRGKFSIAGSWNLLEAIFRVHFGLQNT
jgi:hypothetical protein